MSPRRSTSSSGLAHEHVPGDHRLVESPGAHGVAGGGYAREIHLDVDPGADREARGIRRPAGGDGKLHVEIDTEVVGA
jgi:hypothetical protein